MAEEKKELKNADMNLSQYGDDSSAPNQATVGGQNEKYEGEGVKTSNLNYNPDATVEGLDPNYKFGMEGQYANSDSAGYLARRNDNIASALYNAGTTSKEDVIQYLASQEGWNNSTEMDRVNTVESIWKRLGEYAAQNQKEEPAVQEKPTGGAEAMSADLNKTDDSKIYGKNTADKSNPKKGIEAQEDVNSADRIMEQSRIASLKALEAMDIEAIAASIYTGTYPYGIQAYRDLQTYNNAMYNMVEAKVKQYKAQDTINDIASGGTGYVTADADSKTATIEKTKAGMANEYANTDEEVSSIISSIDSTLSSNKAATSAEETMAALDADMQKLQTRLKNLDKEANSIFKGDTPDYIVRAYINNRTLEINDKLKELQNRYDSAYNRYQKELEEAWKQKEYNLKLRQVQNQEDQQDWNKYYQQYQMAKDSIVKGEDGKTYQYTIGSNGKWYYQEIQEVKQYEGSGMTGKGYTNNNPGNIKDSEFGNVLWNDENGFAVFATPEDGFDALVEKVIFNQTNPKSKYYGKTLLQYFETYSPKYEKDENGNRVQKNDPQARAEKAARWFGGDVTINTKIADLDPLEFAKFIAKTDSGYNYDTYGNYRKESSAPSYEEVYDSIEVPDSVYMKDDGYKNIKVDPNSEEGKELAKAYKEQYLKDNNVLIGGRSELVGEDGVDHNYEIMSSDGETPISFRQALYNLVPTKLKDNVQELENLYKTARDLYKAGVSPEDAALLWYGINPKLDDTTGLLSDVYLLARTSGVPLNEQFYTGLLNATKSYNPTKMITLLENTILGDKIKEEEDKASEIVSWIQQIEDKLASDEGQEFMKQAAEDYADYQKEIKKGKKPEELVGFFNGTINGLMNKYVRADSDYSELASDLSYLYGNIVKEIIGGTSYSDSALGIIGDTVPKMTDYLGTIQNKLKTLKQGQINEVNSRRRRYDLPQLTEYELVDWNLRANKYVDQAEAKKEAIEAAEAESGFQPVL